MGFACSDPPPQLFCAAGGYHTIPITEVDEEVAAAYREHVESQTKELFLPFRCFCSRRGLRCKEVIIEENEVAKAIMEYVSHQSVDKLVLGVSSRNAFLRTFGPSDVPTTIVKGVPEFCSVYIISKGKISASRSAPHPNKHPVHPIPSSGCDPNRVSRPIQNQPQEIKTAQDEVIKMNPGSDIGTATTPGSESSIQDGFERGDCHESYLDISFQSGSSRTSFERPIGHSLHDHLDDYLEISPHHSFLSHYSGTSDNSSLRSFDVGRSEMSGWSNASRAPSMLDFPMSPHSNSGHSWSKSSVDDVESEIQRLRLELKRTMDMYSSACKEALNARQKAREFQSWKMEEERRLEEARLAEGAAMELVEHEKQRCREALEASDAARRAMEIEHRKRMDIEMKLRMEETKKASGDRLTMDLRYRRYGIEEIELATNTFSDINKIGEGGYGPVYKGMLDHTLVAIKVLRPDANQGRQQFQREVEILSCIRHPNMVLLLGACPEYGCLVYEYMANGSLEDRLFRHGNTPTIPWQIRFRIAAEIATGLLFLHQTKPEPLVHRDLKPANILLDHNYVSKISDVGLARLVPPSVADNVTQYRMTAAAGTFCYIDPEYQKTGMLGIKSDIYALGIILLQIITAKPPMGLAHHVERAFEKGVFEEMLDTTIPDWPIEDAAIFAKMALRCAELRRKDRPDLGTIVLPELNRLRDIADESLNHLPTGYVRHQHLNSFQEVMTVGSGENSSTLTDDGS